VKTDDPRLEQGRKKLVERSQKINDLILTVLKSHLIVEQFMNEFLDVSGEEHENLQFKDKADLCETLKPAEIEPAVWKILTAANKPRNKIAHTLDQAQIKSEMDTLRASYVGALTPAQAQGVEGLDDARIASSAFELCGGLLVVATEAAQARKKT
jgi:hypothetical protein